MSSVPLITSERFLQFKASEQYPEIVTASTV